MGEIAEMMLDGTLCACCGTYIEQGEPDGIPRYCCARCRRDSGIDQPRAARRQHQRDAHERPLPDTTGAGR